MTIAIDASRAIREEPTGTELYSARIIQHLAEIDQTNSYILYTPTPPPASFPTLPANWHWKVIPFPRLWSQIRLSLALWQDKPDLLFVPSHVLPLYLPARTIVTIHDIASEIFPQAYSPFARWYLRYAANRAISRATKIITPSQATAQDLIKLYQAPKKKLAVTPLGFDLEQSSQPTELPEAIKRLQPYFVMIGRIEMRKNVTLAMKSLAQLIESSQDARLILIGKPGHGYESIQQYKATLSQKIQSKIIETGYLDDHRTQQYRAGATAFIYPSLYEGFGIPLLEAMAAGTPIIASDSSSIPEVTDDAAILINPESAEELTHAMQVLLGTDLSGEQLAERGKERVKQFSWSKTAAMTLAVINEVLDEN